jgi:Protein of unknown function (DUF3347)
MKQLIFSAIIFTSIFSQEAFARNISRSTPQPVAQPMHQPVAQPTAEPSPLSPILTAYYNVKDALIAGDPKAVAAAAGQLLKAVTAVDKKALPQKEQSAFTALQDKLAFDSRHISESTDINHQREHFTSLSANLFSLAKQTHLSEQPIYEDYCPMKKAYWLSSDLAIKNPYFGSSMPTCGKVSATLKP